MELTVQSSCQAGMSACIGNRKGWLLLCDYNFFFFYTRLTVLTEWLIQYMMKWVIFVTKKTDVLQNMIVHVSQSQCS